MSWVVDGCNQLILPLRPRERLVSWYRREEKHIASVSRRLHRPIVVLDGTTASDETRQKWIARRERELRQGKRSIPQNTDLLVADICKKRGLVTYYDVSHDGDAVVASLAERNGRKVLSRDTDFYRYGGGCLDVRYFDGSGKLVKTPRAKQEGDALCTPQPRCFDEYSTASSKFGRGGSFLRGAADPESEKHGAPSVHIVLSSLRASLYSRPTHELFPCREKDGCRWLDRVVQPSNASHFAGATATELFVRAAPSARLCSPRHAEALLLSIAELVAHRDGEFLSDVLNKVRLVHVACAIHIALYERSVSLSLWTFHFRGLQH